MVIEYCFNIFLWLLLVFLSLNVIVPTFPKIIKSYKMFFILVVTFSTFGVITGDYFHYQELFGTFGKYNNVEHVEKVYSFLAKFVGGNYTLWRFIVWTSSVGLYVLTMKRLKVRPDVASLCFALFTMFYFCSHRQTLAFCIVILAIVLLMRANKKIILSAVAIALFVISVYFHRSMPVYIFLFIIALIPLNRYAYIALICLFPISYHYLGNIFGYLIDISFIREELAAGYTESDLVSATLWGKFTGVITQLPIYLLLCFAIFKTQFQRSVQLPKGARFFLQMSFWQIYTSYLFMGQDMSSFLAPRFREDSLLSLGIFYSLYLTIYKQTSYTRFMLWYLFFSNLFIYMYALYKIL